ncbi:helix-turn-helix domain-containing protein [Brochothrix campestris]|uniref:Mga helix-turn-helix domain-containing protein n=1 Tax=Brochothrix campestris FSL F6-1037 TaxID=1265861 RepID=W7CUU7_9LIST|nr:helix-turn-helix domain-containing protein [Brochothrix campestris]EUJ36718.1 mga helix-turn-helix domain-containing protein [Brochothrix campestris FSL F6-1037]
MRRILSATEQRQLHFIEILVKTDGWIILSEIAKMIGCSDRILKSDVYEINQKFTPFMIETSTKRGLRINYPSHYSIDFVYTVTLNESTGFNMLELLFFNSELTKTTIQTELDISESTLKRAVKKINSVLQEHHVAISTNPYQLVGDEKAVRNLMTHFFKEKYPSGNLPFAAEQRQFITNFFKLMAQKLDIRLNYPDLNLIRAVTFANILRIQKGFSLPEVTTDTPFNPMVSDLLADKTFSETFTALFGIALTLERFWDIFNVFAQTEFVLSASDLQAKALAYPDTIGQTLTSIQSFLENFAMKWQVPIENVEGIAYQIYNLTVWSSGLNFIINDKKTAFMEYITAEFRMFVTNLKTTLSALPFLAEYEWQDAILNEFIYTTIIHWPHLTEHLINHIKPIKVGIFCGQEFQQAQLIETQLKDRFGHHVTSRIMRDEDSDETKGAIETYDVVLSTVSNYLVKDTCTIAVSSLPSMKHWRLIQQLIEADQTNQSFIVSKFVG